MRWGSAAVIALLAHAACAQLPDTLAQALRRTGLPESAIGLVVQPLDSDSAEVAHNAGEAFNPASVMKLLTTLSALDTLGPSHRFTTRVLVDGNLANGILHGNLILQGRGDPALNVERFWALVHEIRSRGIREIHGDIILDNGYFAIDPVDPADFDQSPLKTYNAYPAALLVNSNAMALNLMPQGGMLDGKLDPPALPMEISAHTLADQPCPDGPVSIEVRKQDERLLVSGDYPESCGARVIWLNLMCPAATAALYFKTIWSESGGVVTGQTRLGSPGPNAVLLLERDSIPLSLIVRDTNKFSNNVMAKMLLLDLGAARFGEPATWEKGQAAIQSWLADKGLAIPELVIENGSGLSRRERLSPSSVAMLLAWAARQPLYYEFAASLPALGQEGTQQRRMNGSAHAGRAWLKSGSLNGVRNVAGYFLDASGRRKLMVLFVRDASPAQATRLQEAVIDWALASR